MADTFAPGPIQQIDTSQAQAFAQVYAAAAQVGKQVKAQQLQEQAYTVGTQAIQSQLTSQEAVKQALKGELNIANPLAAEAVRGAAYVDAARAIRDDLKEEWQSNASLSEIHPDGFSVWLRKQLPGKMAEYGINTADPDAARYFAPQMEAGFREITNQQNQQYVAYTNRQVRTQFNTQARETIRSFIENRGQDNISPNDMGMLLDQMHSDASALGISGAERDMLMADAITAQALNYASNVDTLDQANLILASADEIRGGRFSKSAPVQDQLRKAKAEVGHTMARAVTQRDNAMAEHSKAKAYAGAKNLRMLWEGGNPQEALKLEQQLLSDPAIMGQDLAIIDGAVSRFHEAQKRRSEMSDGMSTPGAKDNALQVAIEAAQSGRPDLVEAALLNTMDGLSFSDQAYVRKMAYGALDSAQDERVKVATQFGQDVIKRSTRVVGSFMSAPSEADRQKMDALSAILQVSLIEMTSETKPYMVLKEGAKEPVPFRELSDVDQTQAIMTVFNQRHKDLFGKDLNEMADTVRELRDKVAAEKDATLAKAQADIDRAKQIATEYEARKVEAQQRLRGAAGLVSSTTYESPVTLQWYRDTWEGVRRQKAVLDRDAANATRNQLTQGLDGMLTSGGLSSWEQVGLVTEAKRLVDTFMNNEVTGSLTGPIESPVHVKEPTMLPIDSPLAKLLVASGAATQAEAPRVYNADGTVRQFNEFESAMLYGSPWARPVDYSTKVVVTDINAAMQAVVAYAMQPTPQQAP